LFGFIEGRAYIIAYRSCKRSESSRKSALPSFLSDILREFIEGKGTRKIA
jgi:hypothetical protein